MTMYATQTLLHRRQVHPMHRAAKLDLRVAVLCAGRTSRQWRLRFVFDMVTGRTSRAAATVLAR